MERAYQRSWSPGKQWEAPEVATTRGLVRGLLTRVESSCRTRGGNRYVTVVTTGEGCGFSHTHSEPWRVGGKGSQADLTCRARRRWQSPRRCRRRWTVSSRALVTNFRTSENVAHETPVLVERVKGSVADQVERSRTSRKRRKPERGDLQGVWAEDFRKSLVSEDKARQKKNDVVKVTEGFTVA